MIAVLGLVIAALALVMGIAVPLVIESVKRPKLEIVATTWIPGRPFPFTFASARVVNKPLGIPFRWFLRRDVAQACEVYIDYYKLGSEQKQFSTIQGRWDGQPEPRFLFGAPTASAAEDTNEEQDTPDPLQPVAILYDPLPRQDIAPGEDGQQISVAILTNKDEAFAFSNESYAYELMSKPEWKLTKATYRIVVRVRGSNIGESLQAFILEYLIADFSRFQLKVQG